MKTSSILLFFLFFIGTKGFVLGQNTENDSLITYNIGIDIQNRDVYSRKFIISEIRSHISQPCTNIQVKGDVIQFNTSAIVEESEVNQWISPYDASVTSFKIGNISGSNETIENPRK